MINAAAPPMMNGHDVDGGEPHVPAQLQDHVSVVRPDSGERGSGEVVHNNTPMEPIMIPEPPVNTREQP